MKRCGTKATIYRGEFAIRADLVPPFGTPSRVSEVLRGKKGPSMAMVQHLRFRIPADALLPLPRRASTRRSAKRVAA